MSVAIQEFDSRNEYLQNGRQWVIAMDGDRIVGMASLTGLDDEFPWLNDLFVEPDCRRLGIARALVEATLAVVKRQANAVGVNSGINPKNAASIALAESFGFEHVYTYDDKSRLYALRFTRKENDSFDDEPTDLEPLDEPTKTEKPPALEPPRHTGGRTVSREELERTVEAVRACNSNRKRAKDLLGISLNALYRRLDLAKEAGLDVPAPILGNPKHRERRPQVAESATSEESRPVIVPPRPRRGRPPKPRGKEPGTIAEMVTDRGPVAACEDAIASEFVVMEPQPFELLVRRTKFSEPIVREALKSDRFRKTSGGYALA